MNTQTLRPFALLTIGTLLGCGAPEASERTDLVLTAGGAVLHRVDLATHVDLIEEVRAFERFVVARANSGSCEAPNLEVGLELENRSTVLCSTLGRVDDYVTRLESKIAARAELGGQGLAEAESAAQSGACNGCARGSDFACCSCGKGGLACWLLLL